MREVRCVPVSRVEFMTCAMCGERIPVRLGDVMGPPDLRPRLCTACMRKCAGDGKAKLKKWLGI